MNAQSEPPCSKGIYVAAASDSEKAPLAKIRKEKEERGFLHPLFSPLLLHPNGRFYPPLLLSLRRITLTLAAEEEEDRGKIEQEDPVSTAEEASKSLRYLLQRVPLVTCALTKEDGVKNRKEERNPCY